MAKSFFSEFKVILKHSSIYFVANLLNRVIGFLMIPIYTRFLTPADYGILELITITLNLTSIVLAVGITEAVARFYFDYSDKEGKNAVISTGLIGFIGIAGISFIIFAPLSSSISRLVLGDSAYTSFFLIAIGYMAFDLILQVVFAYLRVAQKSVKLTLFSVLRLLVAVSLNIYFVVFAGIGVKGILLSTLITNFLLLAFLIPNTFRSVGFNLNFGLLKRMARFGAPLILSSVSHQIVTASDRYFIKTFATLADTGLYSLGYKLGALVITFVATPFDMIWTPRRFQNFGKEGYEQIFSRIFTYFIFAIAFVGLYISILMKDILRFMVAEPFWDAYKVVPIITLTYVLYGFYYHFNIGILMKKKTRLYAGINIATGVLNLILNYFLIRAYSIWGAAFATLICYMFKPAITYYFSNRIYRIYMETKRLIMILLCAIIVYGACSLIETGHIFMNIGLKSLAGLSYILILYLVRFFSDDEIQKIKQTAKAVAARVGL